MFNQYKKMIVTCALPYANGSIHLGHLLEHIQADIWVRYNRMIGHEVHFICACDAHGTPIMLKSKELGILPELIINNAIIDHKTIFSKFDISHSSYYTTHSEENYDLLVSIYNTLKRKGLIIKRSFFQFYDNKEGMFLPDRLIKGTCPNCKSVDQYGDVCETCGLVYDSQDLINPKSTISNTTPLLRETEHLFFDLPACSSKIEKWLKSGVLQKQVLNKMQQWLSIGLKQWNISRDKPYFGFKIFDLSEKYFYVWLDAIVGYMGTFKALCDKNNIDFNEFWNKDSNTGLYHFIGKDVIYFHSLFWPAILENSGYRKPSSIFVHGYVTINGAKMSKSKGTFIRANDWLKYLDSDSLRYYYATKLSSKINDIDLNITDLVQKVNSDLVNKLINIASRTANFIEVYFNGYLSKELDNIDLYQNFINSSKNIGDCLLNLEFSNAVRNIMLFAQITNRYIENRSPWKLVKHRSDRLLLHNVCTTAINLFKILMTWLKPLLPSLTRHVEKFLGIELNWYNMAMPLLNYKISPFNCLISRIKLENIHSLIKELSNTN